MKLYKYSGVVLDGNNHVICNNWLSYTHANSAAQALIYFNIRYRKEHKMCSFCRLRIKNVEEL